MTKSFRKLRKKMSPKGQAKARALAERYSEEMRLNQSRNHDKDGRKPENRSAKQR